jgi:hypothetical protein
LQGTVSQSDIAGQSYAFFLSGAGSSGLLATAGALTLDSTGAVSTGVQDLTSFNTSSGIASTQAGLSIATSSTVSVGTGTAPGAAQISDVGGSAFSFDVYAISATHLKLLETDGIQWTVGDVFSQQSSLPSGTLAFTMAGVDTSVFPLALGGLLPVSSGAISGGVEDYNDAGTANSTSSVSGSFTALSGGRSVLTLSSFENGGANQLLGTYSFAAYPSTGGTLLLEIDQAGISGGTALAQTSTSFSSSSGYAVNLSAINTSSEEDDIAEFTATSSSFSGLIDLNDQGSTLFDQTFGGNYASLSTGRYSFSQTSQSGFSGNFYTVDGSTVLFLETDQNQVGIGAFAAQSTPTSSAAANMTHVDVVHPRLPAGRSARWQKK